MEQTNVLLEVAESARVDLKLSPGATTQTVTVTEASSSDQFHRSTLGGTITNTSVPSLPLETRNFLAIAPTAPGRRGHARRERDLHRHQWPARGSRRYTDRGCHSIRLATSNVLINGAQKGGAVDELPLDSIQEFSTQQNPQAEYGWRDGSAVNLAVKSGTNSIHGSAYAFGRDAAATDAKQFSAVPGPESVGNPTIEQPGFTLGGPLVKDKLFWFVSAEFFRQSQFLYGRGHGCNGCDDGRRRGRGCSAKLTTGNCALAWWMHVTIWAARMINPLSAQISGLNTLRLARFARQQLDI